MPNKRSWDFDAAGWVFWTIMWVVLIAPMWYVLKKWLLWPETSPFVTIGAGVVVAAIGAGFVSWGVNELVQRRKKKQRIQQKKKARKQKG